MEICFLQCFRLQTALGSVPPTDRKRQRSSFSLPGRSKAEETGDSAIEIFCYQVLRLACQYEVKRELE